MSSQEQPAKILVVDDDPSIRLMVTSVLEGHGVDISEAESGEQALEMLKEVQPDAILLDVVMPGLDGFEVCHEIKSKERDMAGIPVAMVTGSDDLESIHKAFSEGATDFITKPINYELLPHRVNFMIKASRAIKDIEGEKQKQDQLLKKLEDAQNQLLQSEKLAAIGQLAAGVAHEINNPVGFISSNINTLGDYVNDMMGVIAAYEEIEQGITDQEKIDKVKSKKEEVDLDFIKEDVVELMDQSKDGVIRVKKIVQDLKDFARTDKHEWEVVDLHACINSTLNVANNEIKYKATVDKQFGDIPMIECIASQINQVVLNMVVNASHAIKEKGVITIKTSQVDDKHILLQISDTGSGIDPDKVSKIFDPFFTTKPVGTGTGLGLSLSYGIINEHKGKIEVESELGKGTTFSITLPIKQNEDEANNG